MPDAVRPEDDVHVRWNDGEHVKVRHPTPQALPPTRRELHNGHPLHCEDHKEVPLEELEKPRQGHVDAANREHCHNSQRQNDGLVDEEHEVESARAALRLPEEDPSLLPNAEVGIDLLGQQGVFAVEFQDVPVVGIGALDDSVAETPRKHGDRQEAQGNDEPRPKEAVEKASTTLQERWRLCPVRPQHLVMLRTRVMRRELNLEL
mmetsp:Transcript_12585/g.26515  ORF Transcript_12585/g.26515 Transcript_12585/m.26515 type:complete len:205 (+) Transcript_12585:586-1200(+)